MRGRDGSSATYALTENHHQGGILRVSYAPAPSVGAALQAKAAAYAERVVGELSYVGVLALELFAIGDDLVANEMAPRVHNSGHWTIEGAETSQFENHLRAILGLPLGSPLSCVGASAMVNVIGKHAPIARRSWRSKGRTSTSMARSLRLGASSDTSRFAANRTRRSRRE